MKILGAIVAGGKSTRMGGADKAFMALNGVALIERVKSRLALQVDAVVINANGDPGRFQSLGCAVIPDLLTDAGTPLAGLHAALMHARRQGFDAVFSTPCDAPFIPLDLVKVLQEAGGGKAIIAASGDKSHYLTGFWPVALADVLDDAIRNKGVRRVKDFGRLTNAFELVWPHSIIDPFLNVNTPDDLSYAELMAQM
jgi:molybdenum cofactor guanylyltransferase